MIQVDFTVQNGFVTGFSVSGHSGYAEEGSDIVCAAVSSATLMAANTVTEIMGLDADITVNDGFLTLDLSAQNAQAAQVITDGLRLHLSALSEEYQEFINVTITEV
jgi:uncharacterized protein YsxB (DUF464 family)